MTISFSLSAEAEARLRAQAKELGVTPEQLASQLIESAIARTSPRPGDMAATSSRIAAFREWAGSVKGTDPLDDSRDAVYVGRGGEGSR